MLEYVRERMPKDEHGAHVTANPLLLSMVASVYELRQGIGMPETINELYATASDAMLARGGALPDALRRLLQRVFSRCARLIVLPVLRGRWGNYKNFEHVKLGRANGHLQNPR